MKGRRNKTNKKICSECGELRELLLFGGWGKHKVCMACKDKEKEKEEVKDDKKL